MGLSQVASETHSLSKEDILKHLSVKVLKPAPFPMTLTIMEKTTVEIDDLDNDGRADQWILRVNGVERCRRWSRSGHGAPDAGELFSEAGESLGKGAWGHYDEEEAETQRKAMERELEKRKHPR